MLCDHCEKARFGKKMKVNTDDKSSGKHDKGQTSNFIIDPILAYVSYSMESSVNSNTRHAVTDHFKKEDIIHAKNTLWDHCGKDLPEKPNRKDTTTRSANEAHVGDIVDALSKLGELGKTPRILIDACTLFMIPKSKPEELKPIHLQTE
jgi:hypothetical protein